MKNVVLVAPLFRENTLRYLKALIELDGARVAVISSEPASRIPPYIRQGVEAHYRIDNCLDGAEVARACRAIRGAMGALDCLLGPLEQLQVPIAEARDACGIPGMDTATATAFRDKTVMKNRLRAAGVPCARHKRIESVADAREFVSTVGFPMILKPIDGLGSRGTQRINTGAELDQALRLYQPSPQRPLQAEEFIRGEERTFETATLRGQPVWQSGSFYIPGPLEVIENPWIQYCVLLPHAPDRDFEAFRSINTRALAALGMHTGLSHMEWFVRRDGSYAVSEVGARPPGVLLMPLMGHVHDTDMVSAWCDLMVHGRFTPMPRRRAAGAAFFRGQGQGRRVTAVRGLEEAQAAVGQLVVERQLPTVGQPAATGYEGEGWAILAHDQTEVVQRGLMRLVSLVRVELG